MYRVEVWCNGKPFPDGDHAAAFKEAGDGHWQADMDKRKARKAAKGLERLGLRVLCYDKKYARSGDYRQRFLAANPQRNGLYRCAYCGRRIPRRLMKVDHVVSVHAAKTTRKGKWLLRHRSGVNDLRNLVASCDSCNDRKGASLALRWRVKAFLGRHPAYWAARKIAFALLLALAAAAILHALHAIGAL